MVEMVGMAVGAKSCCLYGRHGHEKRFGEASDHTILETKLKAPACGAHRRKLKEIISKNSRKLRYSRAATREKRFPDFPIEDEFYISNYIGETKSRRENSTPTRSLVTHVVFRGICAGVTKKN
jgi:hypothetical protein